MIPKISLIAGLGGLLYGYDMGIIAAAMVFLRTAFHLSTESQSWVVSIVLVGAMAGALTGGALADGWGRRPTMMAGGILFVAGSTLAMFAPSVAVIIVARALLGVAVGFNSVTAPVYVSELAPPESRGRLVGLYQFTLTCGIALADLVGYWLASSGSWRLMFGLGAIPALLFLLLVFGVPESPRWLLAHGRDSEAVAILESYAGASGAAAILEDLRASLRTAVERRWSALFAPAARRGLIIAVGFTILQQVTGINTVIYYGPRIFALAGVASNQSAIFATFVIAVMNVLATIIALVLVDRVGRKPLLYWGVGGMTASLFVLAFAFHAKEALGASLGLVAAACLSVYIVCFACSMGPIAWILVAEVFPLRLRSRGAAAATLGSGLSNFLVSLTFLSLIEMAGNSATFALYGGFCVLTLLFVRYIVPETKGRELESISQGGGL
ncbi:MAG TPA: sugar porter family MFS transporter [Bryobacteraceae bacterium]|nr:sugar porter family MFS transporter [Bryobacteraceae bacterium]